MHVQFVFTYYSQGKIMKDTYRITPESKLGNGDNFTVSTSVFFF